MDNSGQGFLHRNCDHILKGNLSSKAKAVQPERYACSGDNSDLALSVNASLQGDACLSAVGTH